jgi:hypothetical protein
MRGRAINNGGMRRTAQWEAIQQLKDVQQDADDALQNELVARLGKERYETWARAHLSSLHEWRTAGRQLLDELIFAEVQRELDGETIVEETPHAG